MTDKPPRPTLSDRFMALWPALARLGGLGIGVYEALFDNLDRPSLLAFAGALILVPEVARSQEKRNQKRNGDSQ